MKADMECTVFGAAEIIGKKWTIPLLQEIELNGHKGFNEIQRRLKKISPKILSKRLSELEEKGLVKKEILKNNNVTNTQYKISEKGIEMQKIIATLRKWNQKYHKECSNCLQNICTECLYYY